MFGILFSLLYTASASEIPEKEYRLGAGDDVNVVVHGHDFGRSNFVVNTDGTVSFPFVGQVEVAGLTSVQAENRFRLALMDGYLVDPQVSIRIQAHASQPVDVIGAVGKPGVVLLQGPTTVRALLAQQGGAVQGTSGVVTVHRDGEATRLALKSIEGPEGDFLVRGGDVVEVESGMSVFLAGQVAKPGAVAFSPGITASQALLRAGGRTQYSRLAGAYVVREGEKIKINLKRVLHGKDADLDLMPGDRVVVPNSAL